MYRHFLRLSLRRIQRNSLISFITIFGLAVGITSCILIYLFVATEINYDKSWKDSNRIYRLTQTLHLKDKTDPFALSSLRSGDELQNKLNGIEQFCRLIPIPEQTAWYEGEMYQIKNNYFCEENFLQIFDFPVVYGSKGVSLSEPNTVIISKTISQKIFGKINPLGKLIKFSRNSYKVIGVIDTDKYSTHLKDIDVLLSFSSILPQMKKGLSEDYMLLSCYTYIKVKPNTDKKTLELAANSWSDKIVTPWLKENEVTGKVTFNLQPVEEIHFDTYYIYDLVKKGNKTYVYIFAIVAIFLLLIACFNFMNLTTAQSIKRAKEVAIKKVAGAKRISLIKQFVGESLLQIFISLILSIIFIELLFPTFNLITKNNVSLIASISSLNFWIFILIIIITTGIAGSAYPAIYLSKLLPIDALKSGKTVKPILPYKRFKGEWLSKSLVVLQFTISIGIIASTLVVLSQLNHLKNHETGFKKENIMLLKYPVGDTTLFSKSNLIRNEFEKIPGVLTFATGDNSPGEKTGRILFTYYREGQEQVQSINITRADYTYNQLLGLQIVKGRWFSKEHPSDKYESLIINEAAAEFLGYKNPIGEKLESAIIQGRVIGVVKDYNYASLKESIEPLVFILPSAGKSEVFGRTMMLSLDPDKIENTIAGISGTWKNLFPNYPLQWTFLDESFDMQYEKEEVMLKILGYFSLLTILISCLGLFALSVFSTEKRTKEIGIRKVMGATVNQIIALIMKEFIILVFIAFVIATPLSMYLISKWLNEFSYRIDIPIHIYILTGIMALIIATITTGFRAKKAAVSNPVNSLRYE